MPKADLTDTINSVPQILGAIMSELKTEKWKLRERTGESTPWWNQVEDVSR